MLVGCATTIEQYEKFFLSGYDYIELSAQKTLQQSATEFKQTQLKIKEGPLFCSGFNDFCDHHLPLVGADVNLENIKGCTKKVCERAAELGATQIGVGGPKARLLLDDFSLERAKSQVVENLFEMGEIAQTYQCDILWEALSTCDVDVTVAEAAKTVALVGRTNVKLVVDFFHMKKNKESLSDVSTYQNLIKHVHISSESSLGRDYLRENDRWLDYYVKVASILKEIDYNQTISTETALINSSRAVLTENLEIIRRLFNF